MASGNGAPEHRDGRGEDEAGHIALEHPHRIQQEACAVEIDAVALVEIGLRLAGDDAAR